MKKLFLATGIFLSMSLMASAQEKKAAVKTSATPATSSTQLRKKSKINAATQERIAHKIAVENGTATKAPASKIGTPASETISTPAN